MKYGAINKDDDALSLLWENQLTASVPVSEHSLCPSGRQGETSTPCRGRATALVSRKQVLKTDLPPSSPLSDFREGARQAGTNALQ